MTKDKGADFYSMEEKEHKISAPRLDRYVKFNNDWEIYVNDETQIQILALFKELQALEICGEDELRELWLTIPRGTIEDFGDYDEYLECEEVSNREEFEKLWLDFYPKSAKWYELSAVHWKGWYSVFLNNRLVLQIQPEQKTVFPENRTELAKWLLSAVKETIETVKANTYNGHVKESLPYEKRTGRILREEFWRIDPEEKEAYLKDITQEEIDRFVKLMETPSEGPPEGRLPEMTARKYFDYCRMGYEACNYKGTGELDGPGHYRAHAYDGHSRGLTELNLDSVEEFTTWGHGDGRFGHPWRITNGGSTTSISLYPSKDEKGWWLSLSGANYFNSVDTIKFYLALTDAGVPVSLYKGKELADMIKGRDYIGIVSEDIFPRHCGLLFPGEQIIQYINLPYEDREEIIAAAYWYPLDDVRLIGGL